MRIAYIGNFRAPHSTENEVRKALVHLGHEVVAVQEDRLDWPWLATKATGADGGRPVELVLWTHTHGFAPEDTHAAQAAELAKLRAAGVPTVAYHLDRWWGLEREHQTREPFFTCDLVVTADGGHDEQWAELGVNHRWLPPAIGHEEVGRGTPRAEYRGDVAFVGGWANYGHAGVWPWRKQLIHWLQMHYGDRLALWPRPGEPAIRGAALRDLYASTKVVVGDSCLAGGATRYWSDRIPETLGRGGLLIHPDVPGLDDWFSDEPGVGRYDHLRPLPWRFELGDFDQLGELIERGLGLRDTERDAVTGEAIEWVRELHTYVQRMEQVLEWVNAL